MVASLTNYNNNVIMTAAPAMMAVSRCMRMIGVEVESSVVESMSEW